MKIKLSDIRFIERPDGRPLNPRGPIRDTTDLQLSMAKDGQQEPIRVRLVAPWSDDPTLDPRYAEYEVLRGHRRVVAARALGWDYIEAEIEDDPGGPGAIFTYMLSDFVREDLAPTQVAEALRDLLSFGVTEIAAAHTLGLEPDKARIYLSLIDAPESVRERVDSGEMKLGTYALLRNLGKDVQAAAASVEKPTRENVKAAVREAKAEAAGEQTSMIDGLGSAAEHVLLTELRAMQTHVYQAWGELSPGEKTVALAILSGMVEGLSEVVVTTTVSDHTEAMTDEERDLLKIAPPVTWEPIPALDDAIIEDGFPEDEGYEDDLDSVPWDEELAQEAESQLGAFGKLDGYSERSLRPDLDPADWDTAWDTGENDLQSD